MDASTSTTSTAAVLPVTARGQADMSLVSVDSTVARAHHDAAGMAVEPEVLTCAGRGRSAGKEATEIGQIAPATGDSPPGESERAERRRLRRRRRARLRAAALGRSRGGLTSKVQLAADRRCRPLAFVLTPGQAADSPRFVAVLKEIKVRGPVGRPCTRPDAVAADKAYSSRANRAYRRRGIKAVISEKAGQAANRKKRGTDGGRPVDHDAEQHKERNTVERSSNKIRAWRGLATRHDMTPASYMAGLQLRGSIIWMRSLNPGPRSRGPAGKPDAATKQVRPTR